MKQRRVINRGIVRVLAFTIPLTYGIVFWLQMIHASAGAVEANEIHPVAHWLRDASLALPAVAAAVAIAMWCASKVSREDDVGRVAAATIVTTATAASATMGVGSLVHGRLFDSVTATTPHAHGHGHGASQTMHTLGEFLTSLPIAFPIAALIAALVFRSRQAPAVSAATTAAPATQILRRVVAASLPLALITATFAVPQKATASEGVCGSALRTITYEVSAFQTVIPVNGWGDHVPDGLVYALNGNDARIGKEEMLANPNLTQPMTIRANVGDCIKVILHNDIQGRRVGMHADPIVQFDPKDSDGTHVGNNPDTTIATGQNITYTWYADREGQGALVDAANLDPEDPKHPTLQLGLYGALIVHPRGSTWHNSITGADLLDHNTGRAVEAQVFADVHSPGEDYRSLTMVVGDEMEDVFDRNGKHPTFPTTGIEDSTFGINYRSEPLRNRMRAILEHRGTVTPENPTGEKKTITLPNGKVITPDDHFCDGYVPDLGKIAEDPGAKCMSEESHLQSWVFGDEGKLTRKDASGKIVVDSDLLIPKAYVGDPTRFHVIHPGAKETHPWHQHTQRWFADPNNPDSPRNDVQSIAPGDSRELRLEKGAGGVQGTIGDSIFHCHFYPHFAQGFWGHFRIFDRLRDGSQSYPDGTPLEPLRELPDRAGATPAPDALHPGFPLFVKGDFLQRAYRPPHSVVKDDFAAIRRPGDAPRPPTALEAANMPALNAAKPGAGFIDPCPTTAPVRTYKPHAVDMPITYNSAGWKDRQGRVYVEESHKAAVLSGKEPLEPYTIRGKIGDCMQILTTNDLHLDDDPNVPVDHVNKLDGDYMHEEETSEVSAHVHLVEFDELASDGTSVGWNYSSSAMPGQTFAYRWYIDVALRTVFFHDHQYANLHQQKGLFAAMNVEPVDSTWHDPKTGAEIDGVGTVADIRSPSEPDFREITLFHQDRAPMWKDGGTGEPINPPPAVFDYGADQGGYAFNYRNEPYQIRSGMSATGHKRDPAYIYSSAVHGDPSTPVFRAYHKDPVIVRNAVGSHEEMHTFNLHGHRWLNEPDNPKSSLIDTQSLSIAEYFNYEIQGSLVKKGNSSHTNTMKKASNSIENGTPQILVGGAGTPGDYMYGSTALDDQWLGMWGIFRVPGMKVGDLVTLPDAPGPNGKSVWPALKPGDLLKGAPKTGESKWCPSGSNSVGYSVSAIQKDIVYNPETGDHDPNGVLYVLNEDVDAVLAGTKRPEPLFLRANPGDCLSITLTNKLPSGGIPAHTADVHHMFENADFPTGNRVSMHPSGLLNYDVTRSDGATVGYNYDQTIAPGESIKYTWYVDYPTEGATTNLVDFGDRKGHRHHGLWGGLMIEIPGSWWTNPKTGAMVKSGAEADVKWLDLEGKFHAFREFVIGYQDGLDLRDRAGTPIPVHGDVDDAYELGNRGINYRTERFPPRLATNGQPAWVMSSKVHGDPATPVFEAYVGDPTWVRVLQGSDRGRAHSFLLHGHEWRDQRNDPNSMLRSSQDGVMPARAFTLPLVGGAGGRQQASGDYLYRDGNIVNQTNAGLWGLIRVHGQQVPTLNRLAM